MKPTFGELRSLMLGIIGRPSPCSSLCATVAPAVQAPYPSDNDYEYADTLE
jgi:hypothetical protein